MPKKYEEAYKWIEKMSRFLNEVLCVCKRGCAYVCVCECKKRIPSISCQPRGKDTGSCVWSQVLRNIAKSPFTSLTPLRAS